MTDAPSAPLHLGRQTPLPASPEQAVLDYVPNPRPQALYLARFAAPEFTSLCPVTGQPDFAHLVIDYAPAETFAQVSRRPMVRLKTGRPGLESRSRTK